MFSAQVYESWRATQYEKYAFLLDQLPGFFEGAILDIGCGNNFLKQYLKTKDIRANIIGIDIEYGDLIADGSSLPFPSETFDKIICIDALHLFKPDLHALKKGGVILASIFFNDGNYEEKRKILMDKLPGLKITNEFIFAGKEKELFVVARN